MVTLWTPLKEVPGLGGHLLTALSKHKGTRVFDLLTFFPQWRHFPCLTQNGAREVKLEASLVFKVTRVSQKPPYIVYGHSHPWPTFLKERLSDPDFVPLNLRVIFFKKSPLLKCFHPGASLILSQLWERKQGLEGDYLECAHPKNFLTARNWGDFSPYQAVYGATPPFSGAGFSRIIQKVLSLTATPPEWVSQALRSRLKLPPLLEAIKSLHNPLPHRWEQAKKRLAFDELLATAWSQALYREKNQGLKAPCLRAHPSLSLWQEKVLENFGHTLTQGQSQIFQAVQKDIQSSIPMGRLVHGDVGSGKTILAFLSLFHCAASGYQGVLLAPTEILAQQHKKTFDQLSQGLPFKGATLTGSTRQKASLYQDISQGDISILIGTHALLEEGVRFHRLGLVAIDEQQRFGVHQRLSLVRKNAVNDQNQAGEWPHLLLLTATPIPRTMALHQWGHLDISFLKEKPNHGRPIETFIFPQGSIPHLKQRLANFLNQRERVYWVCPAVEENKASLTPAEARFQDLNCSFPGKVGLLHGKQSAKEKQSVIEEFISGKISILVATTVIEVGIHVPQANLMVVEQSHRFGLAQLHQLRGRVGRGTSPGYCFLLYDPAQLSSQGKQRLHTLRSYQDGFEIAKQDWQLRGSGELLGTRQSGLFAFRFYELDLHDALSPEVQRYRRKLSALKEKNPAPSSPLFPFFQKTLPRMVALFFPSFALDNQFSG